MKIALCAAAIGVTMLTGHGMSASPAQAGYVVTLTQEGSDVVATGSGPIDLTGLTFLLNSSLIAAAMNPSISVIITGTTSEVATADIYHGASGPLSFGSGDQANASSGSGDSVGISAANLVVPTGYVSDSPLSDTATYAGQTFSSLGVTPGVYKSTWGTGTNQNFTLDVVAGAVPEPSTWAMTGLGFGLLGLLGYRKTRLSPVNT